MERHRVGSDIRRAPSGFGQPSPHRVIDHVTNHGLDFEMIAHYPIVETSLPQSFAHNTLEIKSCSGFPRTYQLEAIRVCMLTFDHEVDVIRHERVRMVCKRVSLGMLPEFHQQRFDQFARIQKTLAVMRADCKKETATSHVLGRLQSRGAKASHRDGSCMR